MATLPGHPYSAQQCDDFTYYFFFFFFGCMVASRGGYRMARGRHYAKLSLSNAARLSFSDLCILLFLFLSLCRLCVCVFLCSHWSLVDVPLIFFCPADHVPDWQPLVLLGMVEARSVNVKKTTTATTTLDIKFVGRTSRGHTGGRSHRIFHPPSFCGACLNFSREKDSAIPFPRRP